MPHSAKTRQLIREALREDVGLGDVTTQVFVSPKVSGEAVLLSKGRGILAGSPIVNEVFGFVDSKLKLSWKVQDGRPVKRGQTVCVIRGSVTSILKAERVALNFISRLSGIATGTRQFVSKVKGTRAKIYDTRKTIPLWREIEKYAVKIGGGENHRMGLWDRGFIKDNHWHLVKNISELTQKIKALHQKDVVVEIEEKHLKDLTFILQAKPSVVLLDNFSLPKIKQAVRLVSRFKLKRPSIEVSGGVRLDNVRQIAKTGVDRISIGAITHSAPNIDFSLELRKVSV